MKRLILYISLLLVCVASCNTPQQPLPSTYSIDNTTIISEDYLCEDIYDYSYYIKENLKKQPMILDLNSDDNTILFKVFPYYADVHTKTAGTISTFNPSALSLYSTIETSFPATVNENSIKFYGTIDSESCISKFNGVLKFGKDSEDVSGNSLTIYMHSQKLKETFNWDYNSKWWENYVCLYATRQILKDFDISQCGGFYCELPDTKIPILDKCGLSITDFFNIFFNLDFLDSSQYVDNSQPCINNQFTFGAIRFCNNGNLLSGRCEFIGRISPHSGTGSIETQLTDLLYSPSTIRYVPLNENQIKIYVNSSLTYALACKRQTSVKEDSYYEQYSYITEYYTPATYETLWIDLYNSLSPYLPDGINITKSHFETVRDGVDFYLFSFDYLIAKEMMTCFVNLLHDPNNKRRFVEKFPKEQYSISESELVAVIDSLQDFINSDTRIKLGFQMCPVNGWYVKDSTGNHNPFR